MARVQFPAGAAMEFCLFAIMSRLALGTTQPPIQWIQGAITLGVKWAGYEAEHSCPTKAKAKNVWNYTSTPPICLHGMVLN